MTILDRLDELEKRAAKARAILASNSCQTAAEFDAAEADMAAVQQPAIRNLRALIDAARALDAVRPYFEGEHAYDHPHCKQIRAALAPLMEKADG